LQKLVQTSATAKRQTDYLGGFQYLKATVTGTQRLQFFPTSEGYVSVTFVNATTNSYNYVYNYLDQLGNVRLSYGKDPITNVLTILEENNYYPYGLKHNNYNSNVNAYSLTYIKPVTATVYTNITVNAYKYNGKEYQDELALNEYDMDMRDYDPATARWTGIDPVTHFSESPYCFAANNPVFYNDPSGADYALDWANNQVYYILSVGSSSNWGQSAGNMPNPYDKGVGSAWGDGGLLPSTLYGASAVSFLQGFASIWHEGSIDATPDFIGNDFVNQLGSVNLGYWEKVGNFSNTVAGYASFAGEITNHNWANASFKYGQRINGVVYSADALTNANRASSILWGSRFAKIGVVTNVIGVGFSVNNIVNDYQNGNPINNWDIADATVGTIATASGVASIAIGAGYSVAASLGTAAFLVSNPVGWGIAIGATAYFTYRIISEYNKN
jgi:RHS repeat-associated protein